MNLKNNNERNANNLLEQTARDVRFLALPVFELNVPLANALLPLLSAQHGVGL